MAFYNSYYSNNQLNYSHDDEDHEITVWDDPDHDLIWDDPEEIEEEPVVSKKTHWWVVKLPNRDKKRFTPSYLDIFHD